ncbi:2313_t:CDS:2 [Entrophospora sp. SA101]|nr:2313_t:CDS:2 [Entrophospora sp. SA101]
MSIACSWLSENFGLTETLLNLFYIPYPHTKFIRERNIKVATEEKIISITVGNDSNMVLGSRLLKNSLNIERILCEAHTLQICIKRALNCNDNDGKYKDKKACALYDFLAENTSELSFKEGDILTINYQQCVGWLVAELDGKVGLIPENYVAISSSDGDDEEPIIELEQYNTIPHSSISHNILQLIQIMMQNLDKCSRYGWNCQNRE